MRDLPVHRVVDRRHLVSGDRRHTHGNGAAHLVVQAAAIDQVGNRSIVYRERHVTPVLQWKLEQLLDDVARPLRLELQVHTLPHHRQCLGNAGRMAGHDPRRGPGIEDVERGTAVAGDDAMRVEGRLDDTVQTRRAVQHARQVHHLVDASSLLGPSLEGERRFRVADVSAGGLERSRRCCRRYTWIDLLWQPAAGVDEVLDARQPLRRVRDFVSAFEIGGEPLREGDLGVPPGADATAFTVIVRVDEAGHECHPRGVHPRRRRAGVALDVTDGCDPVAGNRHAPSFEQFTGDRVEQGAAGDYHIRRFLSGGDAHHLEPRTHALLGGSRQRLRPLRWRRRRLLSG